MAHQPRPAVTASPTPAAESPPARHAASTSQPSIAGSFSATAGKSRRPFRVLLGEAHPTLRARIEATGATNQGLNLTVVHSVADARQCLAEGRFDLLMVEAQLPQGDHQGDESGGNDGVADGLAWLEEMAGKGGVWGTGGRRVMQTMVISETADATTATRAMRAGACDFLVKSMSPETLIERLHAAAAKQRRERRRVRRTKQLRRLCRELEQARDEAGAQVEGLCNDLVAAYQELADRMHQPAEPSPGAEYETAMSDELDLEQLLRKTLEYLVEKAGPSNVAVFLPASMDEFSLGGYVNYDCSTQAADMLLDHLADVLAPKVSRQSDVIHVTDDEKLDQWIGDDSVWLSDSHLVAFAACHEEEPLAVVTLFRDSDEPFSASFVRMCEAMGPVLGRVLSRLIRIHHRAIPDAFFGDLDGGDGLV